ncbi:MAG: proton-conducting transporter membrane subunit [Chloroflexota bacterium]|nr:proton-conducting transporter membrane subunit [Chloroflexota bacterium]
MFFLLGGLLLLPLLVGVTLVLLRRPAAPLARRVTVATFGLVTLCALGLLAYGEREVQLPVTWLPGAGALSLHVGGVGLQAALATALVGLVALMLMPEPRQERGALAGGLLLIALASGNAAFLAGHFLGRYVALELVALSVALMPLLQHRNRAGWRDTQFVYLLFRIGDAGMLAGILLLLDIGGTLQIEAALQAGAGESGSRLVWVVVTFLLAVWVKVGACPFDRWLLAGRSLPTQTGAWLYAVMMPNLGLYLLYRIAPLLELSAAQHTVLWLSGASALLALARPLWRPEARMATAPPAYITATLGSLALIAAASGNTALIVWLLLWGTPLRLLLWVVLVPAPATPAPRRALFDGWNRIAKAARDKIEINVLERSITWLAQTIVEVARFLHQTVEQDGLDATLRAMVRGTWRFSRWLQQRHTGRLRVNLTWIILTLVLAVVTLVVRGW